MKATRSRTNALRANTNRAIFGPSDALLTQAPQMIATVVHIPYSLSLECWVEFTATKRRIPAVGHGFTHG